MTWLKANLVPILVGIAVLMAVGTVSGWVNSARYKGIAEAEAASNARMEASRDSAIRIAASARAVSDSITAETIRQRRADSVAIARLSARLSDLSASYASLEAAAEAEMQAHDGWLSRETHERVVANLERTLLLTDSLYRVAESGRRQERERADALEVTVGSLTAEIGKWADLVDGKNRQIAALEAADRGILPDFGDFTKPVYVAVGALIGWGGAKLTQSEAR